METLTRRDLNRALLARQLLLERAALPLPRVLERMAGLQAQYAPSMYVGLWSRVAGFTRDQLTSALEQRAVVQGTLLRSTIHLVSAEDYWPFALAIREHRRRWWLRVATGHPRAAVVEAAVERLRPRLAEGPVQRKELEALVGRDALSGVGLWVDLVRVPPSGTWERRRADLFAAAEDWLGPPPPELTTDTAVEHLVRRYLGGFGPAPRRDIADWAGLPVTVVRAALSRLETRRFRAEDGAELVDLPAAPLPSRTAPAPVRFLPVWDATLLVHARRTGILPEQYRPRIFNTRTPHSVNTFVVDGAVAGTWRYADGSVDLEPFEPLAPRAGAEVRSEADALAEFHAS